MSKSPSLRRIQADIRELSLDPSSSFHAAPLENDMFEWHFTIRGAQGTDFEGGIYHGRILLPPEYPFKPPHIIFLTPSGRFEVNTKVCLSFSAYHPELWQPAWGIRLILEALISFLPTPADGAIGALDWSSTERKRLAKASQSWRCPHCGPICSLIPEVKAKDGEVKKASTSYSKQIAELHRLQQQAEATRGGDTANQNSEDVDTKEVEAGVDAAAVQMELPEEEIVFDIDTDNDEDESDLVEDSREESKVEQENHYSTTATSNPAVPTNENTFEQTEPDQQQEVGVLEDHGDTDTAEAPTSLSWLYDPLLNVLIVLLIVICYLLAQKWMELSLELQELEAWEYSQQLELSQRSETMKDEAVAEL